VAPIQSLKGFTEILSAKAYGVNGGELAAVASNLQRSISQTLRLAENLILWAREQMQSETQVNLEKIKIEDIIVEVYGLYKELAERKDIELTYTADQALVASADKNQLSFVLRNLVNNAIKYTNPKGTVDIAARLHEDRIKISISDNGVGIQESTMINIRNLHRNKSRLGTLGEKGTGLGLMLCYEFIEQNSGSIEVESNPGYGSSFHVFLNRH
jgi:signal transduction histidine kinase